MPDLDDPCPLCRDTGRMTLEVAVDTVSNVLQFQDGSVAEVVDGYATVNCDCPLCDRSLREMTDRLNRAAREITAAYAQGWNDCCARIASGDEVEPIDLGDDVDDAEVVDYDAERDEDFEVWRTNSPRIEFVDENEERYDDPDEHLYDQPRYDDEDEETPDQKGR